MSVAAACEIGSRRRGAIGQPSGWSINSPTGSAASASSLPTSRATSRRSRTGSPRNRSGSGICRRPPRRWSRPTTASPTPRRRCSRRHRPRSAKSRSRAARWRPRSGTSRNLSRRSAASRRRLGAVCSALAQVAKVSGSIEAIAKQTNLLALNATIEAGARRRCRTRLCGGRERSEEPRGSHPPGDASDRRYRSRSRRPGRQPDRRKRRGLAARQERRRRRRSRSRASSPACRTALPGSARRSTASRKAATSNLGHCDTVIEELRTSPRASTCPRPI